MQRVQIIITFKYLESLYMKQIIFISFFYAINFSLCFGQANIRRDTLIQSNSNNYSVIDIQVVTENFMIITCRDDYGRTIQFFKIAPKTTEKNRSKPNLMKLGVTMIPDFSAGTVSPVYDNLIKYKIIKPTYLYKCCTISKIESPKNNPSLQFLIAKEDTSNGLTYFNRIISPGVFLRPGQPIYEGVFNNKRYAIVKSLVENQVNKNIFYSYEFNFITHELYNNPPKEKIDTSIISSNKDPIDSLSSVDSGQTEISSILFGKNMVSGTLHVEAAPATECAINIYNTPDHTLLFNSDQQRTFSLLPGIYDIEISGMLLKNVTVYKAMDTRIKTGALSVSYNLIWALYNENKIKKIYSSSHPKTVEFPKGIYQLEIKGTIHRIVITDGKKLEYDSTIKILPHQKLNIIDSNKIVQSQKINTIDSGNNKIINQPVSTSALDDKKWELKQRLPPNKAPGRIFLTIPKEIECIISISQPNTEKELFYSGALTRQRSFSLVPGIYDIKISGSRIKDVHVQMGMDTRIKAGILNIVSPGIWTLYDEKKDKQVYFSTTSKKIGLPVGIFQLEINGKVQPVIIKDGETVQF